MTTQALLNSRKKSKHDADAARLKKTAQIIKKEKLDALLLNFTPNVSYTCGFFCPDSFLIVEPSEGTLITDSRYTQDFKRRTSYNIKIIELKTSIFKTITQAIKKKSLKKVGFESRHLTFAECEILHNLASKDITFVPLKTTVEPLREIKEETEIALMKKAIEIAQKTYTFVHTILKPGIKELEVAAEIERFVRINGASKTAFDTIVASGPNASYPHASVSSRTIQKGEPIIIDLGVEYEGYKCDLTRTFFLGKINPTVRRAYLAVCQAQQHAIRKIRHGARIKDIDLAARNHIKQKGLDKFFIHSLGHGIGLQVHESPSINKKNSSRLQTGTVFTVEPGIYVAGKYGVRIEDMVLVKHNGSEVLSGNNKHQSN